jgi:hypothetical protein
MNKFLKEISTQKIHKFQESESPLYPELFESANADEILEFELKEAKEAKKNTLIENFNLEIAKPHPIEKAPKLDKLNKPDGFTDAEFRISNPDILKQETTIVFGGLFLIILKYLELLNPEHSKILMQALNSAIPIPYTTKNAKGEEVKIALTGAENFNIFKHLFVRISAKSSQLDLIKNQIENAKTLDELEKIKITF